MVRIGVIGCGQIAQQHFKHYKSLDGVRVVVCADVDENAAERSATEWNVPEWTTDFRKLLERDDVDAVDVCLHNNLHRPVTELALRAGKHVYCEKPMAGSYRDAEAMLDTARETGQKLHIQLATLYSPETRAAQELIELGELGELYHARSTGFRRRGRPYVDGYGTERFVQKRFASGGAAYDMGVYHLAQCLYLLGNPAVERVTGRTYQRVEMDSARQERSGYDVEELGVGFARLAGGATLDFIESWAILLDSIEGPCVVGDQGGVRLRPFGFFRSFGHLDGNVSVDLGAAAYRWDKLEGKGTNYGSSQGHWVAALSGEVPLLPTAEVALNVMLFTEGLYLSEKLGREVTADEVREHSQSTALEV